MVVGKGKFIRHLVKTPSAEQHRNALKAKLAGHAAKPKPAVAPKTPALPGRSPPPPPQVQASLSDQKMDLLAYLDRQHKTWYDEFTQYHLAINQAQEYFRDIMDRKAAPPLGAAILTSVITSLIFIAVPALGPIAQVAEKLHRSEESIKKLAECVCEATKQTMEQFKKDAELAESAQDKAHANSISIDFFAKLYKKISAQANAVTKGHNALSKYVTTNDDPTPLAAKIAGVRTQWQKSSWARPDNDEGQIEADQLALMLLYALMKQYCKDCVSLKGVNSDVALDNPEVPVNAIPRTSISKEMFLRFRRQDSDYNAEFEGLDQARRTKMYDYFRQIQFKTGAIPIPLNWLELIDLWEFKEE